MRNSRPITVTDPHSIASESFRTLQTNLQFANIAADTRVILVTSTLPSEGKTSTAINLAVVSAQAGQRVLLIDGDLRWPQIQYYFQVSNLNGLTKVLLKEMPMEACICPSGVDGLSILPAGITPPNPLAIVSSPSFSDLIQWCKANYDLVIIDSPPIRPVSDALALARIADGVLFLVHAGKTHKAYAKKAMHDLSNMGARILGVVLNRAKQSKRERRLSKKYYQTLSSTPLGQQSTISLLE